MRHKTITACAAAMISAGCAIHVNESDFLHADRPVWSVTSPDPSFRRTTFTVTQSDGNVSRGIKLFSPNARGTVLFFQGNGETVDREGSIRLWQFERLNVNAYILDRRGFGQTPGQPTVALLLSDALETFDRVRSETSGTLIVHGFSLGTSIAGMVAKNRAVDALVIEGGTPNVSEYVSAHLPWYLKLIVHPEVSKELEDTSTSAALSRYSGPVLVAVGEKDPDTVPALAKLLYASLSSSQKELIIVPGAGHYALTTPAGVEDYAVFLHRAVR